LSQANYSTRAATQKDLHKLASLIHFETFVHRHLDYRPPLDWVGHQPFLILEKSGEIVAALACPPDPPEVAWIRLFATSHYLRPEESWNILWPMVKEQFGQYTNIQWAAAIPIHKWFEILAKQSHFERLHRVILFSWENQKPPVQKQHLDCVIRPMTLDDLEPVKAIDQAAFVPLWRNSIAYLEIAFRQAAVATVVEVKGLIVGYQISTTTPIGGHLARLAILPEYQMQGLGYALLCDLLAHFQRRGARSLTVNTQHDNLASVHLYKKAGFIQTAEEYPIYYLPLAESS